MRAPGYFHRLVRTPNPRPRKLPRRVPLAVEQLEDRWVPTAIPDPVGRVLTLSGVPGHDDQITLRSSGGEVHVTWNDMNRSFLDTALDQIRLLTGLGDDTITLESNLSIMIAVEVDGGSGSGTDTLNVNEPPLQNRQYTITSNMVTRSSTSPVTYSNLEYLNINASDRPTTVNVQSTAGGTRTTIDAAGGDNTIHICQQDQFLDFLAGSLAVWGGGDGTDRVDLYDRNNPYSDTFTIQVTNFLQNMWRDYMSTVSFREIERVVLLAGNGDSTFNIVSDPGVLQFLVDAGGGDDVINGGAGNEILLGGSGDDDLYGNGGRDFLVGGAGLDYLQGGAGDDLLVGGITTLNVAQLLAVMAEWTRTDLTGTAAEQYQQRVDHIRNGGGLNGSTKLIRGTTVFSDGVTDHLNGSGELDWFWADPWTSSGTPGTPPVPPIGPVLGDMAWDLAWFGAEVVS